MTHTTVPSSNLYALLIGVDCYLPNRLPDGGSYPSLSGCVRDITQVEAFLRRKLGMQDAQVLKLTATNTGQVQPPEPPEKWPTYEAMVATFNRLTEMAYPGDQVYIHYSGHGGRAPTLRPDLKGQNGLDEALVPADIGYSTARYLRDLELTVLLKRMVDKGLIVTVVLDSCHSGGLSRGPDVAIRGLNTVDTTPRPTDSLVASADELVETWRQLMPGGTRNVKLGSGWLPEPKGYVLLAACRPSESAYEYAFDGRQRNGALTYWLLRVLEDLGPGLSYKLVHDRVIGLVHSQFERQTPQLQGDGDRVVFGSGRVQPDYKVGVLKFEADQQRVLLDSGQSAGLRKDAQFAIYPSDTLDFTRLDQRLGLAKITQIDAAYAWADVKPLGDGRQLPEGAIQPGAQAVLIGPASVAMVRKVRLLLQEDVPQTIDQDAALKAVEQALSRSPATSHSQRTTSSPSNQMAPTKSRTGPGCPLPTCGLSWQRALLGRLRVSHSGWCISLSIMPPAKYATTTRCPPWPASWWSR
jgi:hypothetical protein